MKALYLLLLSFALSNGLAQVTLFEYNPAPFKEAPYSNNHTGIVLSEEFEYYPLFCEGDTVYNNQGKSSPSKGKHDFIAFIPGKSNKKATLFVSHECNDSSSVLGDGGGGTFFNIRKKDYEWKRTGKFNAADFSTVGGTHDNCGGLYIPQIKRVLSAEEFPPESNKQLYKKGKGYRDTSDFDGLKRFENMGWLVEIDPQQKQAVRKLFQLGRFSHESAWLDEEGKNLYMTDDHAPCAFFKFVMETPYHLDKGTLYAYNETNGSHWIALPGERDSLVHIREIALRKGATVFARMEWVTAINGYLYITETGTESVDFSNYQLPAAQLSKHLQPFYHNNTLTYPNGALLALNLRNDQLEVRLEGGKGKADSSKYFSNPDAITSFKSNGRNWLIICEDYISEPHDGNEVWWLDADCKQPTVDSLYRFLVAAPGSETTGVCLSKDRKTLFLNIQHPNGNNTPPFNRSVTLAIRSKSWKATYRGGKGVNVSFW